jgi:hypothetical protein
MLRWPLCALLCVSRNFTTSTVCALFGENPTEKPTAFSHQTWFSCKEIT